MKEAQSTEKRFNRIHAICVRLRDKPCQQCPASEPMPPYGRGTRGCYLLAKEVVDIAVHGNPWGTRGIRKHIHRWRKYFNKRHRLERDDG